MTYPPERTTLASKKSKLLLVVALAASLVSAPFAFAQEPSSAGADLKELITKVQAKLKAGKRTAADLADELKEFDVLLARHKDEKTDEVAQILYMKAVLYVQVLKDPEQGEALFEQLKRDFPDSKQVASLRKQEEAKRIQSTLVEGAKFPDFEEKDVTGKPLSLASYKGRVVLIDFWATWCGPCVRELPHVLATYEKHHANGFEIIGISLDKDQEKLESFTKEKNMPWPQFFDGQFWNNKLAVKYGVNSIPATYLLDRNGKIVARNLRGEDLERAVGRALAGN